MSEYRLEMCDVVKTFPGVKALNHAQLKLKPGTVHALMGENGAGKSTLMKCMFGIYHMDEGKVIYEGQEVQIKDYVPERERRLPDNPSVRRKKRKQLWKHLSILG